MTQFHMRTLETETLGARRSSYHDLPAFTQGYIEAMFFTDTHDDSDIGDAIYEDLSPCAIASIKRDCAAFRKAARWSSYA
jgi:hypothetical protein